MTSQLLGHLLYPPPVRPGPGGQLKKAGSTKSGEQAGGEAGECRQTEEDLTSAKQRAFQQKFDQARSQRLSFMAHEASKRMARLEDEGKQHKTNRAPYDKAANELIWYGGHRQLQYGMPGPREDSEVPGAEWRYMLGACLVYDVLYRLSINTTITNNITLGSDAALYIILLRQHRTGIALRFTEL